MIKNILVAVDGSDHAKKALSLACDLAAKYRARLTFVHVLMINARSESLRSLANRRGMTKKQRDLLDTYEAEFQMQVAASGAAVGFSYVPPPQEIIEIIAQQIMDRAEKTAAKAGVKKTTQIIGDGDPADVILDLAAANNVDMIIMGSRGLSDIKGLLLGSISHKVAARAACTCVTVK